MTLMISCSELGLDYASVSGLMSAPAIVRSGSAGSARRYKRPTFLCAHTLVHPRFGLSLRALKYAR
jgi:hypothetical protein